MSDGRDSLPPISAAPTSLQIAASPHYAFLDGVRGFAALYVVLHHIAIHLPRAANASFAERALRYGFDFGHDFVDVFIVLSGYCLMLPALRRRTLDAAEFLKRRAVRILPPYYAAMLVSWLLIATVIGNPTGTHWDFSIPVHRLDLLTHLTLFQDWVAVTTTKLNHPHWSVAVEWKIYFLFPILLLSWKKWGAWPTLVATTLGSYALWLLLHHYGWLNPSPWGSSVYYLGLFSFGMAAAELGETQGAARLALGRSTNWALGMMMLLLIALAVAAGFRHVPLQIRSLPVGVWAAALMLGLRLGSVPRAVAELFQLRGLRFIGRTGFSLYLTHAPLVQLVWLWLVAPLHLKGLAEVLVLLAVATPVCLLFSWGFYAAVEAPFHRLSRRLAKPVAERGLAAAVGDSA